MNSVQWKSSVTWNTALADEDHDWTLKVKHNFVSFPVTLQQQIMVWYVFVIILIQIMDGPAAIRLEAKHVYISLST